MPRLFVFYSVNKLFIPGTLHLCGTSGLVQLGHKGPVSLFTDSHTLFGELYITGGNPDERVAQA